ncbi:MAG: hypothetical protein K2K30_08945 [Alistipes sp.]|nr:hypothetical protein [Alistipes sp.]
MKKRLFFALLLTVCAAGAFLVSCDKDDDNDGVACTCINWAVDKTQEMYVNSGSYGVADCDDLADAMSEKGGDYECWED